MSKLQELLDARWPLDNEPAGDQYELCRAIFTEGYKAGIGDLKAANEANPYDTAKVLLECKKLIEGGKSLTAMKLYKDTMGCSLTAAKAILNL